MSFTPTQSLMLETMELNKWYNYKDIADLTSLNQSNINKHVKGLVDKKLAEKQNSRPVKIRIINNDDLDNDSLTNYNDQLTNSELTNYEKIKVDESQDINSKDLVNDDSLTNYNDQLTNSELTNYENKQIQIERENLFSDLDIEDFKTALYDKIRAFEINIKRFKKRREGMDKAQLKKELIKSKNYREKQRFKALIKKLEGN